MENEAVTANVNAAAGMGRRSMAAVNTTVEKRSSRRTKKSNGPANQLATPDDKDLYLIEPGTKSDLQISDQVLDQIAEKTIKKSKRLAKQKRKLIE